MVLFMSKGEVNKDGHTWKFYQEYKFMPARGYFRPKSGGLSQLPPSAMSYNDVDKAREYIGDKRTQQDEFSPYKITETIKAKPELMKKGIISRIFNKKYVCAYPIWKDAEKLEGVEIAIGTK